MDAARGPRGLLPPWFPPSLALFALLVRLAVAAHPHSGEGAPPRFGDFDSGILATGQSYDVTFQEPGQYELFCVLHPDMQATVTVTG